LLRTETPAIAQTQEQKIRGGADAVADWVVLVSGYESAALETLWSDELGAKALADAGALPALTAGLYGLRLAKTQAD
jgi:hypothetical protein